jgi:signal transduction histidine kinase
MRIRFRPSEWPFTVKVPLLVMLLMLAISFVISNAVLTRLAATQQRSLQSVSRTYLHGLTVNLSPHILREDVWEVFDILDRARSSSTGLEARHTVVLNPANRIIAASDPRRFPTGQSLALGPLQQVDADGSLSFDPDGASARTLGDVTVQGRKIGSIYTELDISALTAERHAVLRQLIATNAALTLFLMAVGYLAVRRMVGPVRTLAGYLDRSSNGLLEIIPENHLGSPKGEFGRLFRRYNVIATAANERIQLVEQIAEKERLASLGRLASGMAHEINNPLGGLFNALHALKRYGDREVVRNASIDLLERGLSGIRDAVRATLLTYRKPDEKQSLTREDIDDLRVLIAPALREKELVLNWHNAMEGHLALPGRGMRDAILNLLLNACAASPIRATVSFAARRCGEGLEIKVGDEGCGLPAACRQYLEQGDANAGPLGNGGLGLWMVRRLLEETGGSSHVDSDVNGSTIRLTFPVTRKDVRHVA